MNNHKDHKNLQAGKKELIEKITEKKEFSQLPAKDVELAYEKFEKKDLAEYQMLKLVRDFLRKSYSSFSSRKLLSPKDRDVDWFLNKHKSTKERLEFYEQVYSKSFSGFSGNISVIDLGAGINGLSYKFMEKYGVEYVGVEAVGQLVDLMNNYFKKEKIPGKAYHESLFELEKIKKLIKKTSKPRIVFLFKVIDSLEVLERDYSKKLLLELVPLVDRVVLSFATRSLGRRSKFNAQRGWLIKFINENFEMLEDFELGGERYLIFEKR